MYSGFAFPLFNSATKIIECISELSFAILSCKDAKYLITQGKIKKSHYIEYLMEKKNHIINVKAHNVRDKWLVLHEYKNETNTSKKHSHRVWKRNGHQVGIWKSIPTVDIHNVPALRHILNKTYGSFGFERERTKCFGLNIYTGKEVLVDFIIYIPILFVICHIFNLILLHVR